MISQTPNRNLMAQARQALSGSWGLAIGAHFVYAVLVYGVAQLKVPIFDGENELTPLSFLFAGPLLIGLCGFFISMLNENAQFVQIFDGFNRVIKSFCAYFVYTLLILLWALLLIIPGIVKTYSYAMTFYILAESPEIGVLEAITRSRELMDGHKLKYFCLQWRFFGWLLLSVLTLGVGLLWLGPYLQASNAAFYRDIKDPA